MQMPDWFLQFLRMQQMAPTVADPREVQQQLQMQPQGPMRSEGTEYAQAHRGAQDAYRALQPNDVSAAAQQYEPNAMQRVQEAAQALRMRNQTGAQTGYRY